ncbi:hypothetical protein [Paraburkholderia sp. BCC1884]|uniref:hypothetical protein n=1 Tax=Paraburkholderia sp. BCC1884 TaxID=2562668 RepID=UPI001184554D|nr:hypothetical protein [Paraburkholderia sp. BCC1884]
MTALLDQTTGAGAASAESVRFTADDRDKIQDYVTYASSLPTVLQLVKVYVGSETVGVAGLEPADLRSLFERIHSNADEWEPAKEAIHRQTTALMLIADRIVPSGESLIRAIQAMPAYVRARTTIGDASGALPHIDIPDERFGPDDLQKRGLLAGQMASLQAINREKVGDTEQAMHLLASFRAGIEVLEPVVAGKRLAVKHLNPERIGNEITVEPMIAALQREYERAVQTDSRNAASIAAKKRALDTAIQTLKSQIDVYRDKQRVTYTMGRLFVHLTQLGTVMLDAEMATGHLWLAWREAGAALESAAEQFESIDSNRKLLTFVVEFQVIVNNWKFVQDRATELSGIF